MRDNKKTEELQMCIKVKKFNDKPKKPTLINSKELQLNGVAQDSNYCIGQSWDFEFLLMRFEASNSG